MLRQKIAALGVTEMKPRNFVFFLALMASVSPAIAQLPPLGGATQPEQPAKSTTAAPAGSLTVEAANADLKAARAANQEKRFADAEALMLRDTAAKPGMLYLWIELGLAQLGLKKYPDAEASFNAAFESRRNGPEAAFLHCLLSGRRTNRRGCCRRHFRSAAGPEKQVRN